MVIALSPFDGKVAARQAHGDAAIGAIEPGCRYRHGAGRRAAGLGQAGATLPGADHDMLARRRRGERDVGALREQRIVLERGTDRGKIVGGRVVDPEDSVRVARTDG